MHDSGQGDAFAQAMDAQRQAKEALEREKTNREAIDYIRERQTVLEEMLALREDVSAEIERRTIERKKIEIPATVLGETVIPVGYEGHIEGTHIVFRPVSE